MSVDVLIPVRNPTEVLLDTARSLAGQERRNFRVLLSDNFSSSGADHLEAAAAIIAGAGIDCVRLRPPTELGRVEHWNWLHYQSTAEWMKPLFAGDVLLPPYFTHCLRAISEHPGLGYFYAAYYLLQQGENREVIPTWAGTPQAVESMQKVVLAHGMQFGPPSVACYSARVWFKLGGYVTSLPVCADSLLFCQMAGETASLGDRTPLVKFHIHENRFSNALISMQAMRRREQRYFYLALTHHALLNRWGIPWWRHLKLYLKSWLKSR